MKYYIVNIALVRLGYLFMETNGGITIMKIKRITKKLNINKVTVAFLDNNGMDHVLGGVIQSGAYCTVKTNCCETEMTTCPTWGPVRCTAYPKLLCLN